MMNKLNKIIALLAVLAFAALLPMAAFADNANNQDKPKGVQTEKNNEAELDETDETTEVDEVEVEVEKEKEAKPWKAAKDAVQQEKDSIELLKDQVEEEITELESQLDAAAASGDTALVESLTTQIAELKVQKDIYKEEMKQKIQEMQEIMKEKYTQEELDQLAQITEELETVSGIKVLSVTNVFMKDKDIKFDTPPVIKDGRTLIPLRAISEATGAEVAWNSETKTITITKDDNEIIMKVDENKITLNGTEIVLDVPAQLMHSRTVVPLRFIVENLELKVNWDDETETIEIEEPNETEDTTETE